MNTKEVMNELMKEFKSVILSAETNDNRYMIALHGQGDDILAHLATIISNMAGQSNVSPFAIISDLMQLFIEGVDDNAETGIDTEDNGSQTD